MLPRCSSAGMLPGTLPDPRGGPVRIRAAGIASGGRATSPGVGGSLGLRCRLARLWCRALASGPPWLDRSPLALSQGSWRSRSAASRTLDGSGRFASVLRHPGRWCCLSAMVDGCGIGSRPCGSAHRAVGPVVSRGPSRYCRSCWSRSPAVAAERWSLFGRSGPVRSGRGPRHWPLFDRCREHRTRDGASMSIPLSHVVRPTCCQLSTMAPRGVTPQGVASGNA